ncbi:MAG: hypothetical protein WAP13_04050, partial [Brevefilum fermentans]
PFSYEPPATIAILGALKFSRQGHQVGCPAQVWTVVWINSINGGKPVDNPLNCVKKLGINTESQVRHAWLSFGGEKNVLKTLVPSV